jgi:amino acid adenylation domain-containing protein/non-ribosomal peptide synthase protein (TIGR01720 family)
VFATHHIVSDGWSVGVLVRELATLYAAFRVGLPSPLERLPVQYADFALWQRRWLSGEALERELSYWRTQLAGAEPLELPLDRPRPPIQSFRGAKLRRPFPMGMADPLRALGRREGVTPFMALLAAFDVVLARWSRQDDVVIGSAAANRTRREIEPLIGFFVNSLVLRTRLEGDPTFRDFLRAVRETALGAYAHQDLPFEKLVMELHPTRDLAREPLFQLMFTLQNAPSGALELPGELVLQPIEVDNETAKFDLIVTVWEAGDGLVSVAEYSTDLFEAVTISRLLGHFEQFLSEAIERPASRVSELSLLTPAERRQLQEVSAPDLDGRELESVQRSLEIQVDRAPEAAAVVQGESWLSYGELNSRVNQLARYLRRLGVRPEERVGVFVDRSPEMVVGILGVLKSGGAYVPLDPSIPNERLKYMLEDSGAAVVLSTRALAERLPEGGAELVRLDSDWEIIGREDRDDPSREATLSNLAYVIYTSGSTGRPKGVSVTQGGLANLVRWHQGRYAVAASDRATQLAGLSFDASVWEVWPYLTAGASVHLVDEETRSSPSRLVEWLSEESITLAFLPTPLAESVLKERWPTSVRLRALLTGGDQLHRASEDPLPFELWNHYGPTEDSVVTTHGVVIRDGERAPPIGRPIANKRVSVLDGHDNQVPVGVSGELCIAGVGLARGYLARPELTAEKFVPDPYSEAAGGRRYRTGDLVRWRTDGQLEFVGRNDQQVKIRGFRVELGEVEAVLAEEGSVSQSAVVLQEGPDGQKRLIGYVVRPGRERGSIREVREYLRSKLPEHMIPAQIVEVERLPMTPSGKVDRRSLPRVERTREELGSAYVAPRSPIEERIARLWAEVLLVDRVGVHDNFFELGGDSILAIQVVARAHERQLHFAPRQIFEHQTVAELARAARTDGGVHAEQGPVTGSAPLTPIQRWFFDQQLPEAHHFNQAAVLELPQAVDPRLLRSAVGRLLAQHDALRMRFERESAGWRQWITAPDDGEADRVFVTVDLGRLGEESQGRALEAAAAELQGSLNLERGPLLRLGLLRMGAGPDRLLLVIHHLAVDGVSWRVLQQDLLTAYQRVSSGEAIGFMPKTTSFKSWGERLLEYAETDALGGEIEFWREVAGAEFTPLPLDRIDGVNDVASTEVITVALDADETSDLLHKVPPVYRTRINDVLLTAATMAFGRWTGRRSLSLWMEGHGREDLFEDVDLSRTVGWFTTLFPVALDIEGAEGPGNALRRVKEQLRRIPRNGIGYGLLRHLRGDRELARELGARDPRVSFNYQGRWGRGGVSASTAPPAASAGPLHGSRNPRAQVLEINGSTVADRLQLRFTYSTNLHHRATIQRLADGFIDSLRELIAHCLTSEAGGYSPADFPLADLDQAALDRLFRGDRNLEDLYPASPMQAGLLFHTVLTNATGMYFAQYSADLRGELSVDSFRRAWQRVMDAHAILRTHFVWDGLKEPVQVVRSGVALPWEERDLRAMSGPDRERALDDYLEADRRRGFDPGVAPLMRAGLIRLEDDVWRFVWSFHHLLLDGWSVPLVLREMMTYYVGFQSGQEVSPEPGPPYREYISWLRGQELSKAEGFWRAQLAGFTRPTLMAGTAGRDPGDAGSDYDSLRVYLDQPSTAMLRSLAREQRLSLNTLVQGALALLLSDRTGERDVIFGTTSAGRPATLRGVESMIGLFINTLPLRVLVRGDDVLVPWLQEIQRRHAEAREYEFTALLSIQTWSGMARGFPLFDTHQVFDNYPVDRSLEGMEHVALAVENLRTYTRANFPLSLVGAAGDETLSLKLLYDAVAFERDQVEKMLSGLQAILTHMGREPQSSVGDLLEVLAGNDRRFDAELERKLGETASAMLTRTRRRPISASGDQGAREGSP